MNELDDAEAALAESRDDDLHDAITAWAELRTALGQRTDDALVIRRAWSIFA